MVIFFPFWSTMWSYFTHFFLFKCMFTFCKHFRQLLIWRNGRNNEHLFIRRSSQNNCHCALYQLCKILDYFKFWFRMTIRNEKRLPVTNIAKARCPTNAYVIMLVWKVSNWCSYITCSWKSKILNIVGRCCVVLQASWPSKIRGRRKLIIFIFVFKKSYTLWYLLTLM